MKVVGVNLFVATYIMTSSYKNNYFTPRTVKTQKIHSKFWDLIFLNHFLEAKTNAYIQPLLIRNS